jgi:hypothetical protein
MRTSIIYSIIALALVGAFRALDKDNDGTIDKNESRAVPFVEKNFDMIG